MLLGVFVSAVENLVLVALPHGGQQQARRNAWLATIEGSTPHGQVLPAARQATPQRRGVAHYP